MAGYASGGARLGAPKAPKPMGGPPVRPFTPAPKPGTVLSGQQRTGPTPGGGASGASQGSNLDSTYFNNVAGNLFKTNQAINALNLQGNEAGTTLQQALGRLAYAQPRAALGLEQGWNWGGRDINSTPYAQSQGDLANAYQDKQTAAQTGYGNTMSTIASRIAGLQGGLAPYDTGQALASTGRAARLAASEPAPPAAAPTAPARSVAQRLTPAQFNRQFNQKFNREFNQDYRQRLAKKLGGKR